MLRSLALTGVALLVGAVAGCGGGSDGSADSQSADANSTEQYCSALQRAQKEFGALESGDVTGANLDKIFDRMHTLSEQAPPAVTDEWRTLDGAITKMESGLQDLGLSFGDLSDPKKLSQVDPQKLQKFGQEMQKIGGRQFQQAGNKIEKHARTECNIKLGQN